MRYDQLPTEPPAYDGGEAPETTDEDQHLRHEMELMDFDDPHAVRPGFRERVDRARLALRHKLMDPMRLKVLDPLAEGYAFLHHKWESWLARLGNPLIVKRFVYVILVGALLYAIVMSGYLPDDSSRTNGSFSDRDKLEDFAELAIDLKNMEENLEYLSSVDHMAGTKGDLSIAKYVSAYFKSRGLSNVEMDEIPTLVNYPGTTTLKYGDTTLDLSAQFNPMSKQGSVTGKLIYVHYGRIEDYNALQPKNLDPKDCVCMMKMGSIPMSQKVMIAESFGCSGLLFVSEDDSFPDSYERRSVAIPEFYLGDPLSPGWSSAGTEEKLKMKDATMSKLPSVSLTWNQAKRLWDSLGEDGVAFNDGLHSGEKKLEVTLDNQVVYKESHPTWNVLCKIPGREQGELALVIGAQRDAPCKGAVYPDTGTVVLLELAQLFEKMRAKFNWQPLRSIYFISWDATQYNLAGVAELMELNMEAIRGETMAYIDLSDAVAGDKIEARGSALLSDMLGQYQDEYNLTIGQQFDEYGNYVPFMVQGVPVMEIGYKGGAYPKYSCDDTFEKFKSDKIDPDFMKHRTLVELVLKLALHIVEDPMVPFEITAYVEQLNTDFKDLQAYASRVHPDKHYDFGAITSALLELKQLGRDLDLWRRAWLEILQDDGGLEPSLLALHRWSWNLRLCGLEKFFLSQEGIPGRPWYKNPVAGPQLFKPDFEASWWSFPGVRDAIQQGGDVQAQINTAGELISEGCRRFVQG